MSAPIIITVPNNYLTVDEMDSNVVVDISPPPSRKRRLDHLSWEEKMQRKKLKNRVAAQTSRDRKKAKMDDMEDKLKKIMDMNERLLGEVENLKVMNERLLSENSKLRSDAAARTVAGAPRPAESHPQQKEGPPSAIRAARLLLAMCLLSQTSSPTSTLKSSTLMTSMNLQNPSSKKLMAVLQERLKMLVKIRKSSECSEGNKVVGTPTKQLEPSRSEDIDTKHDINRILAQHSYAHPYPDNMEVQIKEENGDKGDIFYASYEANDCITIEVPSEDIIEDVPSIEEDSDFNTLTNNCTEITLECDMKMLSPMSLSPQSIEDNLLGVSPTHTNFSSDLGYESLASPLSEPESMDLSDFWCESFSELFPGLA